MILDATCGIGHVWPAHATIRIDIRGKCRPDLVMDARDLKFPDRFFDQIYCDPPHIILPMSSRRKEAAWRKQFYRRFGIWDDRQDWLDFIKRTNQEFHRCLKSNGTLHYKLTDSDNHSVRLSELLRGMTMFIVEKERTEISRSNTSHGRVHWLTMKPKAQP